MKLWELVQLYKRGLFTVFSGEFKFICVCRKTEDEKKTVVGAYHDFDRIVFLEHKDDKVASFKRNLDNGITIYLYPIQKEE